MLAARLVHPRTTIARSIVSNYHTTFKKQVENDGTAKKNWADPASRRYKFWNREEDAKAAGKYSFLIEMSPESIRKEARILSLSDPADAANTALHGATDADVLPLGSTLVGVGTSVEDFDADCRPNVVFVSPSCPHAATVLPQILQRYASTIEWVHVRSAGIDFVESDELVDLTTDRIQVTNAKGQFSSSLAEYALMACSYFAKDIPRLMRQQAAGVWEPYNVEEL